MDQDGEFSNNIRGHLPWFEETALHYIARRRTRYLLRFILNTGDEDINALTANKSTVLHCALERPFSWPIRSVEINEIEAIVDMLLETEIDVNARNDKSETALYLACKLGLEQVPKKLMAKGAEVDVAELESGYTALHWASAYTTAEVVLEFLERGARINAVSRKGITPLFAACDEQNVETVELLLKQNAEINHVTDANLSPLLVSVIHSNTQIIELLVKAGADPYFSLGTGWSALWTALSMAWSVGDFEPFKTFVQYAGVNVDYPYLGNSTMLHLACDRQDTRNINDLLELGANVAHRNDEGRRPIDLLDLNELEIQSMKRLIFDRYTTLYDLFVNINKMTRYANRKDLKEMMEVTIFPKFGGLLKAQWDRARSRGELMEKAKLWMQKLTKLTEHCVENILEYLDEEELSNFIFSNLHKNMESLSLTNA